MSNKYLLAICVFAICLSPTLLLSQDGASISGTVTNVNGEALPGASVFLEGLNVGSATDIDGHYFFKVAPQIINSTKGHEQKLMVRYIGYRSQTQKVVLAPGKITQDFALEEDVLAMEAIVVTGVLGEVPKEKLAFSVSTVSEEKLQTVPSTDAMSGIRGKVAGAKVVQSRGEPGTGVSVRLRGSTSITGSASPLYVVDGVILGANQVDIDGLDIESMEIVKGAAAASVYGSRAENGVIQIKTRRGNQLALNKTRMIVRNEYGINQIPIDHKDYIAQHHQYKVQGDNYVDSDGNVVDFGAAVLDKEESGVVFQDNNFVGQIYDNFDLFFDPGTFNRNYVSLGNNSASTNYQVSFGNVSDPGVVVGQDGYNRKNVRLNFDHKISHALDFSFTGYYSDSKRDDAEGSDNPNPFYGMMFINPNANLLAPNSDGTPYIIQPDPRTLEENPLYAVHNAEIAFKRQRTQGSFNMRYSPLAWMDFKGNVSFDRSNRQREEYYPRGFKTIDGGLNTGEYERFESHDQAINASFDVTFSRQFGDLTSRTQLRYLYEDDEYGNIFAQGQDLAVSNVRDLGVAAGDKTINSGFEEIKSLGYYFMSSFDYKDKYIGDLLVRRDGSSLFGEDERWHNYYRFSGAYRLSQENWWSMDAINEMKLRYSYGTAGGRPAFSGQFETFSVNSGVVAQDQLGNKELKPEFAIEQEFGLNMALWDRFALELTYAKSNVEDQLLNVPLAGYFGFSSQWQNAGTLESNTFEASLDASLYHKKDMSWSAALVFDRTRQKIAEFDLPPYRFGPGSAFYNRKGEVFGAMYGKLWMTSKGELATHEGGIHANSLDQFDVNDDGLLVPVGAGNAYTDGISKNLWGTSVEIDGESYDWGMPINFIEEDGTTFSKIGDALPDFNLGLSNTFKWKGFNAYILFDAEVGGEIYNNTRQWAYRELRHTDSDQAGKAEDKKKPIDYYAELYNVNAVNSWFVESGTYLKLRELNLSYTFNHSRLNNIMGGSLGKYLQRVEFGVIGRNLLTFTDYSGFDPEVSDPGSSDATLFRFDGFRYPAFRTFTGYLELEF